MPGSPVPPSTTAWREDVNRQAARDLAPTVGRPRGAAWRALNADGIVWEGQVLIVGAETDLAARLIITSHRFVLARGGAIALDSRREWLRPSPSLEEGDVFRVVIVPTDGSDGEKVDLLLQVREGRRAAAHVVSLLASAGVRPVAAGTPAMAPPRPYVSVEQARAHPPSGFESTSALPDLPDLVRHPLVVGWEEPILVPARGAPNGVGRNHDWNLQAGRGVAPRGERRRRSWLGRATGLLLVLIAASIGANWYGAPHLPDRVVEQSPPRQDGSANRANLVRETAIASRAGVPTSAALLAPPYSGRSMRARLGSRTVESLSVGGMSSGTPAATTAPQRVAIVDTPRETTPIPPSSAQIPSPTATPSWVVALGIATATETATVTATTPPVATSTPPPMTATATQLPATVIATATTAPPTATATVPPVATMTAPPPATATEVPATATATTAPPTATATASPVATTTPLPPPATATEIPASAMSTATSAPPTAMETAPPVETTTPLPPVATATEVPATVIATATAAAPTATATAVVTTTPALPIQPPSLGLNELADQTLVAGIFRYTVEGAVRGVALPALALPNNGYGEWVVLTIYAANTSNQPAVVNMTSFQLVADGGVAVLDVGTAQIAAYAGLNPAFSHTQAITFAPGQGHRLLLLYLVTPGAVNLTLLAGDTPLRLDVALENTVDITAFGAPPAPLIAVEATVTRIIDGQTIDVSLDGVTQRVRYLGVRAPVGEECWVEEATAANAALVAGRQVELERQRTNTDAAGSLLRDVWLRNPDGGRVFVAAALALSGNVEAEASEPNIRYAGWLEAVTARAQSGATGQWAVCGVAAVVEAPPTVNLAEAPPTAANDVAPTPTAISTEGENIIVPMGLVSGVRSA